MFFTIIIFIIILGILVFVHEFGHFIVAKKSGMHVHEFGFGFPPRIAGFQKINGKFKWVWGHRSPQDPSYTVYSLNWIPLGGFVKILGENNEQENNPKSFINKGFWPRFFTLIAGVSMNVVLAWILLSIGFAVGLPVAVSNLEDVPSNAIFKDAQPTILNVVKDLPADKAGLMPSDSLISIDNNVFTTVSEIQTYVKGHAGTEVVFQVKRGGENLNIPVTPDTNPPEGQGPTGIELGLVGKLRYPWYSSVWQGAKATWLGVRSIVEGLGQMVSGQVGLDAVGGPVKIAQFVGQARETGIMSLLNLTVILSLSLAVLNIVPFPALDGGRVLFLIIEKIRGKRNNQKVEQIFNTAGFMFLIFLMILVTIKDIRGA